MIVSTFKETFLVLRHDDHDYYSALKAWNNLIYATESMTNWRKFTGFLNALFMDALLPVKLVTEFPLRLLDNLLHNILNGMCELQEDWEDADTLGKQLKHIILYPFIGILFPIAKIVKGVSILCRLATSPWKTWREADAVGPITGVVARATSAVLMTAASFAACVFAAPLIPIAAITAIGLGIRLYAGAIGAFCMNVFTFGKSCGDSPIQRPATNTISESAHAFMDNEEDLIPEAPSRSTGDEYTEYKRSYSTSSSASTHSLFRYRPGSSNKIITEESDEDYTTAPSSPQKRY